MTSQKATEISSENILESINLDYLIDVKYSRVKYVTQLAAYFKISEEEVANLTDDKIKVYILGIGKDLGLAGNAIEL
jgi:hypothetical protein